MNVLRRCASHTPSFDFGIRSLSLAAASSEQPSTSSISSSSASEATVAGWILKKIKEHPRVEKQKSSYWTRKDKEGNPIPIPRWEKILWGMGATGFALILAPRVQSYFRKVDPEEIARKEIEQKNLSAQRSVMIPAMLSGKSFLDEENAKLYDGMSPKEINGLAVGKFGSTGASDDPFEGLSPEEIDAMFASTES